MTVTLRPCPALIAFAIATSGCQSALFTSAVNAVGSRVPALTMTESEEQELGAASYREILSQSPRSTHPEYQDIVERVGRRIATVSGKRDYDWEFTVLAGPTQNAFCLPGGKVAVYEGLLPLCENEAGLAVVMSHEIAHAIARHGGERMRNQALVDAVGEVVEKSSQDDQVRDRLLIQGVYGAASQVGVILPFSRAHESEADSIGLMLMARAGYDPNEAPLFWRRFRKSQSSSVPEIFSTHPADERRAADLEDLLPQAGKFYEVAASRVGKGVTIPQLAVTPTSSSQVNGLIQPPHKIEIVEPSAFVDPSKDSGKVEEEPSVVADPFLNQPLVENQPPEEASPVEEPLLLDETTAEDPGWVPAGS